MSCRDTVIARDILASMKWRLGKRSSLAMKKNLKIAIFWIEVYLDSYAPTHLDP